MSGPFAVWAKHSLKEPPETRARLQLLFPENYKLIVLVPLQAQENFAFPIENAKSSFSDLYSKQRPLRAF